MVLYAIVHYLPGDSSEGWGLLADLVVTPNTLSVAFGPRWGLTTASSALSTAIRKPAGGCSILLPTFTSSISLFGISYYIMFINIILFKLTVISSTKFVLPEAIFVPDRFYNVYKHVLVWFLAHVLWECKCKNNFLFLVKFECYRHVWLESTSGRAGSLLYWCRGSLKGANLRTQWSLCCQCWDPFMRGLLL